MPAKWRKRLKWGFYVGSFAIMAGFGIRYVQTTILPYSRVYNQNAQLSTIPNGVGHDATAKTEGGGGTITAKTVRLTPVRTETKANDTFSEGVEFRLSILDARGKLVTQGLGEITVTLSSTSPAGMFDTGTAVVMNDATPELAIRYHDTQAGSARLAAFVSGLVGGTMTANILPNTATKITAITPAITSPRMGSAQVYTVTVTDKYNNAVGGGLVNWSVVSDQPTQPYSSAQAIPADDQGISRFNLDLPADRANIPDIVSATFAASSANLRIIPQSR